MIFHHQDQSYSFYIFYCRAWEMMFGGIAFLFAERVKNFSDKSRNIIVTSALIIILGSIYIINSHSVQWPSSLTLIPVASTTAILLCNVKWSIFENRIISFIGNISYSLYLWHWPFYVLSLFFSVNDRLRYKIALILLSLIFSSLSFFFLEKRNYQNKSIDIAAVSVFLFLISYSISVKIPENMFDNKIEKLVIAKTKYVDSKVAADQYSLNDKYFKYDQKFSEYNLQKIQIDNSKKYIVLIGDSHAGMFAETLHKIVKNTSYELLQITAD